jgi:hypothetical protein
MTRPANAEIERLCDYCIAFAKESLKTDEQTPISGLAAAELIKGGLRRLASERQASVLALCWDGFISIEGVAGAKSEAIVIGMEHENGEAIDVFIPYRKRLFLGYSFGDRIEVGRARSFFSGE